ncbi:MAG TPA: metal ABC transporter permease [Marmoricola sp.]|nr:metal ABC transporter permease [Marmoricola sp.]
MIVDISLLPSGFLGNEAVRQALLLGLIVPVVAGAIGVMVVIRGESFAAHSLGALGTVGGSVAALTSIAPLLGYVSAGAVAALTMGVSGTLRRRDRDVVTGMVLSTALGVSALLLYLAATSPHSNGTTSSVLFGSIFALSGISLPWCVAVALACLVVLAVLGRPLLLSSVNPDIAAARGVRIRLLALAFLLLLAAAAALASVAVGTMLSTALLIGPPATALRLTRRPGSAIAMAVVIGVVETWVGILLAYLSYNWPPVHTGWPVSFFIVGLVVLGYLTSLTVRGRR